MATRVSSVSMAPDECVCRRVIRWGSRGALWLFVVTLALACGGPSSAANLTGCLVLCFAGMNTTYRGRFSGMFDEHAADVIEQALEMIDYGDEIFWAEIALETFVPVAEVVGPGSVHEPIDLTDDDDDVRPPFWGMIDEMEAGRLLNQN